MADEKKQPDVWRMDAAAYLPEPAGYLKLDGQEYPIYSFLDVSVEDSLRVVRIADDINNADTYEDRLSRSIKQIMILNAGPEWGREGRKLLTEEQLRRLAPRQLVTLTLYATSVAEVPQKADEGEQSGSPAPAPASADSMAGLTAR